MDLITELGALALATRLKRLSERLTQDVNKIYKELDLNFESKWFLVLDLLSKNKMLSIVDIAEALKLTHPAIVQFVDQLLKAKLISVHKDLKDARKRLVALSPRGKRLLDELAPTLAIIKAENENWLQEADHNLLDTLAQLEQALDEQSMYYRIKKQMVPAEEGL